MAQKIPQFVYPFRMENGEFVTAEQDSDDDVVSCVAVVLLHHPGDRELLPEFGVLDPTFGHSPIDTSDILSAVEKWEPRASQVLSQELRDSDPLIVDIVDNISTREASNV